MKTTFMNSPEDILWLNSTHLKGRNPPLFRSFILYGNEDSPERLELFSRTDPDHDDPYYEVNLKEQP